MFYFAKINNDSLRYECTCANRKREIVECIVN